MRKKILLIPFLAFPLLVNAQPGVNESNKESLMLSEVVAAYKQQTAAVKKTGDKKEKNGKVIKEGADHQFGRWLWYWQQHTDQNGYMVSSAKTMSEWSKYMSATNRSKAKTTAGNLSNWSFQGPVMSPGGYSGLGRINAMDFHPTDANTYWVATAGGGLWKTTSNGTSWTALTDKLPVLSTSDVDVNPLNSNTIYLCTGDRDGRDHYSIGVLKSIDGGTNWDTTGLKWGISQIRLANTLLINPKDTNSLILATSEGIYRSFNGGTNWNNVKPGNFKQVLYHPTDTNVVYATSFYTASATPAQIYRSADGGNTWQQITNFSRAWRIALAVTPANRAIVKAVVASFDPGNFRGLEGVYSSSDTGKTFTQIYGPQGGGGNCTGNLLTHDVDGFGCTGQGNYDLTIAIYPGNENAVVVGGVNAWASADGGTNWEIINQWTGFIPGLATVHADKHWHGFHPLNPNRLFECNDGGIYYTDNLDNWVHISNGLGITQFYRNAVVSTTDMVLAGAQDNGTKMLDGTWTDETGGDGMDCQIDYVDPSVYYTGVQYGVIYRNGMGWPEQISDNIPGQPEGAWITPYVISSFDNTHILAGYKDIYFSNDRGDSWTSVTGSPLDPNKYLLRLGITPASQSTIYAVHENSNVIFYTHSFNGSTTTFFTLNPPAAGSISDIKVDTKDKDHFWITYSGYNSPQVYEHKSGAWTQLNQNLPNVPINCFEADSANGILYVGTDVGVFYRDSAMAQWELYSANLPAVHITDLGINYTKGEICAATYGRGLWKSPKQEYNVGISLIPFAPDAFVLSPNPSKGAFAVNTSIASIKGQKVTVRLIDNTGKTVWNNTAAFNNAGKLDVQTKGLAAGVYIFEAAGSSNIIGRQRIVIE